jgi:hypothetical protein
MVFARRTAHSQRLLEEEMMIESISKYGLRAALLTGVAAVFALPSLHNADAHGGRRVLKADLTGFHETPSTLSTTGSGEFRAVVSKDRTSFEYTLKFRDLEANVTQAHIHFGARGLNGGISIWLCGTTTNPGPAGTPDCGGPNAGGATRTITAADVIGPAGQGIAATEFAEILDAMESGYAYANVHSVKYPGGEIRDQINDHD